MTETAPAFAALPRSRGRPREFDLDGALDKAVRVFSERGYHATTVGDLTDAMELAAGSVYKAFKDKRTVFLAAFDRYKTVRDRKLQGAIRADKSGRDKLHDVLAFYAEASQGPEGRRGCLVVAGAVELAPFDPEVAARVKGALRKNEAVLADLIRQGQSDGSIPSSVDGEATARLLVCLTQGLRVAGKTGRSRAELASVVEIAMKLVS
jgi:TetR/AcrR family transcriptional regulator, transcriptional repressor for nem operon